MQLSNLENRVYEKLKKEGFSVFRIRDICLLMNINKTKVYNIIKALNRKKAIIKIKNGLFAFRGANELEIASSINYPSYISFWTALNYYGYSDQNPNKIFLATTKYSKDIGNFKFVTISKNRFFGYISKGDIVIADREKAFVDSLLFPKYSGGMKEIGRCLKYAVEKKEIDAKKLMKHALFMKSKAVLRRLGFLIENSGYKANLSNLNKRIGKGYELLDPSLKKKNNLNKKWLLDINW